MSAGSTAGLPIGLRREHFGGILFDPVDATFIELDAEAYEHVLAFASHRRWPEQGEAAALFAELHENVPGLSGRAFRVIDPQPVVETARVPVLSAPTLVDFQITNLCHLDCPHCYADSTSQGEHGRIEDIELALEQIAEVGAFQLAIGGGEPLLHPHLERILIRCHELGIVPNLTTSGLNLNRRTAAMLARYCGAVGVSLEGVGEDFDRYRRTGFTRFERTVALLQQHGVPVVLQVTLNVETFRRLGEIVDYCASRPDLYGVIFLAYKQVGRGATFGQSLAELPHREIDAGLQAAFDTLSRNTRVGFDCCLTPGVTGVAAGYDEHAAQYLEGCSALRTSIGLSAQLDVMPCTFTAEHAVGNLRQTHLAEIWRDLNTRRFRDNMHARAASNASCGTCAKHSYCLGGCPVMDLVNCARDYLGSPRVVSLP